MQPEQGSIWNEAIMSPSASSLCWKLEIWNSWALLMIKSGTQSWFGREDAQLKHCSWAMKRFPFTHRQWVLLTLQNVQTGRFFPNYLGYVWKNISLKVNKYDAQNLSYKLIIQWAHEYSLKEMYLPPLLIQMVEQCISLKSWAETAYSLPDLSVNKENSHGKPISGWKKTN